MLILAVDVGTGTQDILLFDSRREVENCLKMVMPSPTVRLADAVRADTRRGDDVLLAGVLMGGGPCACRLAETAAEVDPAVNLRANEPQRVRPRGFSLRNPGETAGCVPCGGVFGGGFLAALARINVVGYPDRCIARRFLTA